VTAKDEQSILILNVGSSTLKFGLFPLAESDDPLLQGVLEYEGHAGSQLRLVDSRRGKTESLQLPANRESAPTALLGYLESSSLFRNVKAVGHRLVHGGSKLCEPVTIDPAIRALLEEVVPFAPDHLPTELRAIDEVSRFAPAVAQLNASHRAPVRTAEVALGLRCDSLRLSWALL
jgi:acetate kinase